MHRPIFNPLLLILAITSLASAAWLYLQNETLRRDLAREITASSVIEQEIRQESVRTAQALSAKTKAERLLVDLGDELKEAQRAKEAALLSLKEAREQLVTPKLD
jgi:hypothetical protein